MEIPDEDLTAADRRSDNVGHLKMSLYGTRDAAMSWQEEVAREMVKWVLKEDGITLAYITTRQPVSYVWCTETIS